MARHRVCRGRSVLRGARGEDQCRRRRASPLRARVRSHLSAVSPEKTPRPLPGSLGGTSLSGCLPAQCVHLNPNKLDVFVAGLNYGGLYLDCIMPNISFRERSCGYFSPLSPSLSLCLSLSLRKATYRMPVVCGHMENAAAGPAPCLLLFSSLASDCLVSHQQITCWTSSSFSLRMYLLLQSTLPTPHAQMV